MTRTATRSLLAAVGLVALAGVAWWAIRDRASRPVAADAARATVERRDLEITAESSGLIEPVRVVEVKSRASGEVRSVLVESGAVVEAGALLAEIDPRDVSNAHAQAEADLASARVGASIAESQLERMRRLREQGVVAELELDQATDAAASARAGVVRAETNLALARERLGDVTIRAPIAGTILARQVEPGQIIASATANVSGGTAMFSMADLAEMRARARIDEVDIGRIRPGQSARVTVEAYPGRVFAGRVEKVEPQAVVEQNVTLFPVLVRLDERGAPAAAGDERRGGDRDRPARARPHGAELRARLPARVRRGGSRGRARARCGARGAARRRRRRRRERRAGRRGERRTAAWTRRGWASRGCSGTWAAKSRPAPGGRASSSSSTKPASRRRGGCGWGSPTGTPPRSSTG